MIQQIFPEKDISAMSSILAKFVLCISETAISELPVEILILIPIPKRAIIWR